MKTSRSWLVGCALVLSAGNVWAQFPQGDTRGSGRSDASEDTGPTIRYQTEFSHSFSSDLNRAERTLGSFQASHFGLEGNLGYRTSEAYSWEIGLGWQMSDFETPSEVPAPDSLHAVFLRFSNQWRFADRWSLRSDLRPGVYSDFQDLSGDDLNLPFTVVLSYAYRPTLTFVAGLNFNFRSDLPVIGGPGVIWRFAENWQLRALIPKPQVLYTPNREWTLFVGGELKSATGRVAEDLGTRFGQPGLNNDTLSYREIRVGAGARYQFHRLFALTVEGGYAIDRRFQYDRAELLLNGDGAPYLQVSLNGSF